MSGKVKGGGGVGAGGGCKAVGIDMVSAYPATLKSGYADTDGAVVMRFETQLRAHRKSRSFRRARLSMMAATVMMGASLTLSLLSPAPAELFIAVGQIVWACACLIVLGAFHLSIAHMKRLESGLIKLESNAQYGKVRAYGGNGSCAQQGATGGKEGGGHE